MHPKELHGWRSSPDLSRFQRETSAGMKRLGAGMTKTITPIAAGFAIAFGKAFHRGRYGARLDTCRDWSNGKAFETLKASMATWERRSPNPSRRWARS
jgi:hypothetical protein